MPDGKVAEKTWPACLQLNNLWQNSLLQLCFKHWTIKVTLLWVLGVVFPLSLGSYCSVLGRSKKDSNGSSGTSTRPKSTKAFLTDGSVTTLKTPSFPSLSRQSILVLNYLCHRSILSTKLLLNLLLFQFKHITFYLTTWREQFVPLPPCRNF